MGAPRYVLVLALALTLSALPGDVSSAAPAPRIGTPIPVPPREMPPLPPALIDNALAIGGENIDARKENTRMTVEVMVNGRGPYHFLVDNGADTSVVGLPVDAVVDTGSEITIGNLALRDKLIPGNRGKFLTIPATGVTGVTVNLHLAKIAELKLGSVTLRNVPIAFADVPPFAVFGLSRQPALLLGTDLLDTFRRVSLDFQARKVRFQLRKCGTSGVLISTSQMNSYSRITSGDDGAVCKR